MATMTPVPTEPDKVSTIGQKLLEAWAGGTQRGAWSATRDRTGLPACGNGRPGDLRRLRNRPGFLNYREEPAQSSAVTLARGTATAATLLSQHMQVPSGFRNRALIH